MQNNTTVIAKDIMQHNSFLAIIISLSKNTLDSLVELLEDENKEYYARMNDAEKYQLLEEIHSLCERLANSY